MRNTWQFAGGWQRDLPDHRDFTLRHEQIVEATARLAIADGQRPQHVDWREYCPAAADEQQPPTGAVHACIGLVQYFERRAHGRSIEPSRLFVYRNAHRLAARTGDSGISLRVTLKAIRRFGLPPEEYWPYCADNLQREPEAFTYSFRDESDSLAYVRVDAPGVPGPTVLESARELLAAGFCFVLGFTLSDSVDASSMIAHPTLLDRARGGQAVVAVGYDDRLRIRSDKGALLIRSSWGTAWGEHGYGWLPYSFVCDGLAADLWTVVRPDWLQSGEFRQPQAAVLGAST